MIFLTCLAQGTYGIILKLRLLGPCFELSRSTVFVFELDTLSPLLVRTRKTSKNNFIPIFLYFYKKGKYTYGQIKSNQSS